MLKVCLFALRGLFEVWLIRGHPQAFLKSKSQPVSGKKADLMERVEDYLGTH